MTLFQILYDAGPKGHWVFLLVTIILGGATAYVTGKSVAETWRPIWHAVLYALLTALVVRFIHFALFEEVLLSLRNYCVDCGVLLAATITGYLITRRRQMAAQYSVLAAAPRAS
jgi:predicted permease